MGTGVRNSVVVATLALASCAADRPLPSPLLWSPGLLLPPIALEAAPEAPATASAEAAPPLALAVGPGGRAISVGAEERDGWIVHPITGWELDGSEAFSMLSVLVPGRSGDTPFAATDEGAVLAAAPLVAPEDGERELPISGPSLVLLGFEGEVRWSEPLQAGFCGVAGDRAGGFWILADGVAERRDAKDGRVLARVELGRCGRLAASDEGDALLVWDGAGATLIGAGGNVHRTLEAAPESPFTWAQVGPSMALLRVGPFGGVVALPRGGGPGVLVAEPRVEAPRGEKLARVDLPHREQIGTALEVRGRLVVATEDRLRVYGADGAVEKTLTLSCPGSDIGAIGCHAISAAAAPGSPAYLVLARFRSHPGGEPKIDLTGAWLVALDPRSLQVKWRATVPDVVPGGVGAAALGALRGPWRHEDAVLAWRSSEGLLWYRP